MLQEKSSQGGLKGAPEPDLLFLYITNCDINTTVHDIERVIIENFKQVTEARVRSTARSHNYYASFTVTLKGNNLDADDFLGAEEVFPRPIRVFLNRNKYQDQECV